MTAAAARPLGTARAASATVDDASWGSGGSKAQGRGLGAGRAAAAQNAVGAGTENRLLPPTVAPTVSHVNGQRVKGQRLALEAQVKAGAMPHELALFRNQATLVAQHLTPRARLHMTRPGARGGLPCCWRDASGFIDGLHGTFAPVGDVPHLFTFAAEVAAVAKKSRIVTRRSMGARWPRAFR